jgi:hypothetical protein
MKQMMKDFLLFAVIVLLTTNSFCETPLLTVSELYREADLVCVATIDQVQQEGLNTKAKFANAQIIETWKGPKRKSIRFRAYPVWECDSSDAIKGETVLLFLNETDSKVYEIVNSGQGRWPLQSSEKTWTVKITEYDLMSDEEFSKQKDNSAMSKSRNIQLGELARFLKEGLKPK